jgi:hypothetical protein
MTPEDHEQKFNQLSRNIAKLADQLVADHPEFPKVDFGRAFLTVALGLLLDATSDATTADYLRQLADDLENTRHLD